MPAEYRYIVIEVVLSGDVNFVRSKMLEFYDSAGIKVWGCSLCSYSHKEGLFDHRTYPGFFIFFLFFFYFFFWYRGGV
jgi:hypothetical protein